MAYREFLVRKKEISDPKYGKYPGARSAEEILDLGLFVLDKPRGYVCHEIDSIIKRITGVKKCSHGGTLDPNVSGVLLIALNRATKLMQIFLKENKEYIALIYLHKDIPEEKIRAAVSEFLGKIKQMPPVKSAVARRLREREIYYFDILEIDGRSILARIGCEAGTYIRKLADDLGKKLGAGAHLQELRRTKSGLFTEEQAITLQEFIRKFLAGEVKDFIMPVEIIADAFPVVIVLDSAIGSITQGSPLYVAGISRVEKGIEPGDIVMMLSGKGELVGVGIAKMTSDEMISARRGIAVQTDIVLMRQGVYPRKTK